MDRLTELLETARSDLAMTAHRWHYLVAFEDELKRVSRGKDFRVWNDMAWMMALDSRDILVIHLASWSKALFQKGGLFGWLKSSVPGTALRDKLTHTDQDKADPHLAELRQEARSRVYRRVFPEAAGGVPAKGDLEGVGDRFKLRFEAVKNDRDDNRAHSFERSRGRVAMLDFGAIGKTIEYAAQVLHDLRLLADDVSTSIDEAGHADSTAAEDLVDAILIGTSRRRAVVTNGRTRQQYYEDAHLLHDQLGSAASKLFNEMPTRNGAAPEVTDGG